MISAERRFGVDVDVELRAQELDAGVRDRLANENLSGGDGGLERFERPRNCDASLDVGAELAERQLDRGERRRDVEDVEPADVADPEDLRLSAAPCPGASVTPCRSRRCSSNSSESIPSGARTAVTTAAESSSGEKSSRPIALMPGAGRAAEPNVPLERRLEPVREDQPERDVEAPDQRDRRSERSVELVLRRLVRTPVEVEAAARASRGPGRARAPRPSRARVGTSAPSASRRATTSIPHASVSSGTAPSDEIASTTSVASPTASFSPRTSETTPVEVSDCWQSTSSTPCLAHRCSDLGRIRRLAPLVPDRVDLDTRAARRSRSSARRTTRG